MCVIVCSSLSVVFDATDIVIFIYIQNISGDFPVSWPFFFPINEHYFKQLLDQKILLRKCSCVNACRVFSTGQASSLFSVESDCHFTTAKITSTTLQPDILIGEVNGVFAIHSIFLLCLALKPIFLFLCYTVRLFLKL